MLGVTYVIHGSPLKMSSRTRLYWEVTHVTLKDIASVIGTNGEEEYKSLEDFGLSRDCYIYREPIRLVRQINVGEILNRASNFAYYNEHHTSFSTVVGERRACASL
jgi:hypothetical protein